MLPLEWRANALRVLDIENPPQVQYPLPFRQAFEAARLETVIAARDYGKHVVAGARKRHGVEAGVA